MNKVLGIILIATILFGCKSKVEKIHATAEDITESVYASGTIKSVNQYQVFATVNGIVQEIYVQEGDTVNEGTPLLLLSNEASKLNKQNAELTAAHTDYNANQNKLNELKVTIDFARIKLQNDSLQYSRQQSLWNQQVGSQIELEQRLLAFQNSKTAYQSALLKYDELQKQLRFVSQQSKKNLQISKKQESDFTVKSEINGRVYSLLKEKGEMVSVQTPLAVLGDANIFKLELQVDEYDIVRVQKGQQVLITLDSYKGKVFEARVSKINPIMNERTKTFTIEADFINAPQELFPNLTVEANIVLQTKKNVLTLPRHVVNNDGTVTKSNGDKVTVQTGLKDYQKIEIISGISADDELIVPAK
ncbi:MAG: efflux RND transporter periplasmic adaptor subunit [Bacteroidota bacterium]